MATPPAASSSSQAWLAWLGTGMRCAMLLPCVAVATVAVLSVRAPSVPEAVRNPSAFATERGMRTVAQLAQAPHPVGSAEHRRVQALIRAMLQDLDLEVLTLPATSCSELAGQLRCAEVTNIVGRLAGTGNGDAILLDAHTGG